MASLRSWLRDLFRRRAVERELDAELRFHLEQQVEEHLTAGLTPAEAQRRARAEFGGLEAVREECREARATWRLETELQDLRYGVRVLRRNPGFTATAIATLALTIAAVSTVFTLVHSFYRRLLPVPDAGSVIEVRATRRGGSELGFVSYLDYVDFRDATRTLRGLAAVYPSAELSVTNEEAAYEVDGAVVSANFFPLLGIEPERGRFFRPDEDSVPGRDHVVVISHEFWRGWFASSESALGAELRINGVPFTVIGVLPAAFPGISQVPARIYMPAMMLGVGYRWCAALTEPDCTILRMLGRPVEGASISQVAAEMQTLVPQRWKDADPGENSGISVFTPRPARPGPGETRTIDLLALAAGALLLACCANLAGLLIARADARERELSIRGALGAGTGRLLRQLLWESLLLALGGGGLGILLSIGLTARLSASFFSADAEGRPLHYNFSLEPTVIVTLIALSILVGLVFGVLPHYVRRGARAGACPDRRDRRPRAPAPRAGCWAPRRRSRSPW